MFGYPHNKDEEKRQDRLRYENAKSELTDFFYQQKYNKGDLNVILINSLKKMGFNEELREDGLL